MTTVNFPPEMGGDDVTIDDTDSPTTGLGNGGHRLRFVLALQQFLKVAQWCLGALQDVIGYKNEAATSASNAATSASEADFARVAAEEAAAAAGDAQGTINSRFYGALASDPTVRPNGSPMQAGDRYFNTTTAREMLYTGAVWMNPNVGAADLVNPSDVAKGDALVAVVQPYDGALVRSQHDKNKDNVSLEDFVVGNGVADDTAQMAKASAVGDVDIYNGKGRTFAVSALPDLSRFSHAAFKRGSIRHITEDFLRQNTSKITFGREYTNWPQDKAYVLNNQIRVWVNCGDSHLDGDLRPAVVVSDDGGSSWESPELLDENLFGYTTWCAGTDGTYEYVIVRKDVDSSHSLYKRTVPSGTAGDYYAAWTVTPITFPVPVWGSGQPVMVHSFTVGHGGSIVVGFHYGTGAGLYRSTDQGATWTAYTIQQSSDAEEPSVKWDSASGNYYGFLRSGDAINPQFWVSTDNLATFSFYRAPVGYFGAQPLGDSPVPLQIVNGVVHAFCSYRSGTLEGAGSDGPTSAFYIRAKLSNGANIWDHAETFRLGTLFHAETGGASGVGVGSVVAYQDKIFLFYGGEERTGTAPNSTSTTVSVNRITNIFQTVIPLNVRDGVIDYRSGLISPRASTAPAKRAGGLRWVQKEGRQTYSLGHRLSASYATAVASVSYNTAIFDLLGNVGGHTFATDASGFVGYYVAGPLGVGGTQIDTSSGTWRAYVGGAEAFRWDAAAPSLRPGTDNNRSCGSTLRRWSEVWAGNGTIQTSDENHKEEIQPIDERALRAWGQVQFCQYKMKDAVAAKGSAGARWHVGVIAQRVREAFEAEGLDPFAYGLLCYDEWPEVPERVCEQTGEVLDPYQPAGFRYSVRYDEALALECAYLRSRLEAAVQP
ncbi:hypothetical protein N234_31595 [Ralstonia pickettii DTP0602]|nr:hypothetical protein N234_31595 [Ralstonia pickettii DTP0602]